jgi:transposase-like protein
VYKKLAERALVNKAVEEARRVARKNFRRKYPPRYWCTKCIRTFAFERGLTAHWHAGCAKKDVS